MNRIQKSWRTWKSIANQPWYYGGVTFLILVTGGLGSIWSGEIRNAIPFYWGPYGDEWPRQAVVFWTMAIVATALVCVRQFSVDEQRDAAHSELRSDTNTLKSVIRTMPPEHFLEEFAFTYALPDHSVAVALNDKEPEKHIDRAIRIILRAIADLARKFDGNRLGASYAANIMHYRETASLTPDERTLCQERLMFCEEGVRIEGLPGLLILNPQWSSDQSEDDTPDPELKDEIVLPVPSKHRDNGGKHKVLMGAPLAFVSGKVSWYPDTRELDAWFKKEADFSKSVQQQVVDYFGNNQNVRSFASIPLFGSDQVVEAAGEEMTRPLAILNVHSSLPNLLRGDGGRDPIDSFNAITKPLTYLLIKLVRKSVDTEDDASNLPNL